MLKQNATLDFVFIVALNFQTIILNAFKSSLRASAPYQPESADLPCAKIKILTHAP